MSALLFQMVSVNKNVFVSHLPKPSSPSLLKIRKFWSWLRICSGRCNFIRCNLYGKWFLFIFDEGIQYLFDIWYFLAISVFAKVLASSPFKIFLSSCLKSSTLTLYSVSLSFSKNLKDYMNNTHRNDKMWNSYVNLITRPLHTSPEQFSIVVPKKFFWHLHTSFPSGIW